MIRIRRLHDLASPFDRVLLDRIRAIFRAAFPTAAAEADKLLDRLARAAELRYEVLLLVGEDQNRRLRGFALAYHFANARSVYLDYLASDPSRPAHGVGGALYEALRELASRKGARGIYMDVPPDDAGVVADRTRLAANRRRLAFYERFGARPIEGGAYQEIAPGVVPYDPPLLVFDGLGRQEPLTRADVRRAVEEILVHKHGWARADPYVVKTVASFRDDPVRLRAPRYEPEPPAVVPRSDRLLPLRVVVTEHHELHHVRERGYVERPARVEAILRGLAGLPFESVKVRRHAEDVILAVHQREFVSYLKAVCAKLDPGELLYPYVFPIRNPGRKPKERAVRAGYYCIDTFTPLYRGAWEAARAAVDCAATGADLVLAGERLVYALCRPPGHHAERGVFGGFCYFNNAAIAAQMLSARGKVALLDLDYHHGNGSQDIFYSRADVLFVSIHGHPNHAYPYFSGFADERGEGAGLGFNLNLPLPEESDEARYLQALEVALAAVRRFAPAALVLSIGFDTMRGDPTGSFSLSTRSFRTIGRAIGRLSVPTLVVQEGGYSVGNLRSGARAFFEGTLESAWAPGQVPPAAKKAPEPR